MPRINPLRKNKPAETKPATEEGQKELKTITDSIKKQLEEKAFQGIDKSKLNSFTIRTNPTTGEVTISDLYGIYGITNRQGKWVAESPNGKFLSGDSNLNNVINKVQQTTTFIAAKNNKSQYYKDLLNIGKMDISGLQSLAKNVQENEQNADQKKLVLDKINSLIKAMPESKPEPAKLNKEEINDIIEDTTILAENENMQELKRYIETTSSEGKKGKELEIHNIEMDVFKKEYAKRMKNLASEAKK